MQESSQGQPKDFDPGPDWLTVAELVRKTGESHGLIGQWIKKYGHAIKAGESLKLPDGKTIPWLVGRGNRRLIHPDGVKDILSRSLRVKRPKSAKRQYAEEMAKRRTPSFSDEELAYD